MRKKAHTLVGVGSAERRLRPTAGGAACWTEEHCDIAGPVRGLQG